MFEILGTYSTELIVGIISLILLNWLYKAGIQTIKEDEVGILIRKFSLIPFTQKSKFGKVSLAFEAGIRPNLLLSGTKWVSPFVYTVIKEKVVKIKDNEIGIVTAHFGLSKPSGINFPPVISCENYENAKEFLLNGGYKGVQLDVITVGTWLINTKIFSVSIEQVCVIEPNEIGIVTTYDGQLLNGEIASPIVPNHNKFRDAEAFLKNGGYMGLQEEILEDGKYAINPHFAKVKKVPTTRIDTTEVGVLQSRFGKELKDTNANVLVEKGFKGVLKEVLYNGDHRINTDIYKVILVPLNDITLEWTDDEKQDKGRYDANLKAIKLNSIDKYEFKMPLTQTIRIKPESAPLLIKRMGGSFIEINKEKNESLSGNNLNSGKRYESIRQFVYRFLGPQVRETFQQIAQGYEALKFYEGLSHIQNHAADLILGKLEYYGVEAISTVIDFIDFPPELDEVIKNKQKLKALDDIQEIETRIKQQELNLKLLEAKNEAESKSLLLEAIKKEIEAKYGNHNNYMMILIYEAMSKIQWPTIYSNNSKDSTTESFFALEMLEKIKLQVVNNNPTFYQQLKLEKDENNNPKLGE
jgi:hypothetical protein